MVADFQIRQLGADDAQAFSTLRRELTADNPIPMGLTMEEELARPLLISSAAWALGLASPCSQFSIERGLVRTEVASACLRTAISGR